MDIPNSNNTCITTTAVPRPELLEKTYDSFKKNISWLDFKKMTLFINIDRLPANPFPDLELENIEKCKKIASDYFGEVFINIGYANFPQAVKWVFSQANKDFVFNIEDDWELLCDIPSKITDFFHNPDIIQVGLRAWKSSEPRFVLSPSLLRTSFCNLVSSKMNTSKNPEEQIRGINPYNTKKSFIYWPFEDNKIVLRDLGRPWMKTSCYGRGLDDFISWRFLPNSITRWRDQVYLDQGKDIDMSKLDGNFRGPNVSN